MAKKLNHKELQKRGKEQEATEAMQFSQDKPFERLFNLSLDMLCVAGLDGYFRIINAAFETTLGHSREVFLETPFIEFVHPDDVSSTLESVAQLSTGAPVTYFENRYRCKDGSYKWLAWTSMPMIDEGLLYAVARDITDKKRSEAERQYHQQEMAHVARLSTAGEMASGMAHELNQPLTAITSYCGTAASLLSSMSSPPAQLGEILERTTQQAHRASEIIRHLREFISKENLHKELLGIDKIISSVLEFLKFEVQEANIKIEFCPASKICTVEVDKVQIEQVLINLVRNSLEAISNANISSGQIVLQTRVLPNNLVEVTVADNGPGVNAETIYSIFAPFKTYKETGMGLGLSLSRTIIEAYDGKLWVDKDYQDGARFGFELPVIA